MWGRWICWEGSGACSSISISIFSSIGVAVRVTVRIVSFRFRFRRMRRSRFISVSLILTTSRHWLIRSRGPASSPHNQLTDTVMIADTVVMIISTSHSPLLPLVSAY